MSGSLFVSRETKNTYLDERAAERRVAADQRALESQFKARVSRLELSRVMAPIAAAAQQHEVLLSFISERGLVVRDGRAYLDEDELKQYLEAKRSESSKSK